MSSRFEPIDSKFPQFFHGADYNPDQWLKSPEILAEDIRLMKLAHCNTMSVGIFSWATLEPEEGRFDFAFLDKVMDTFAKNDMYAVLATPSGARPAWMSERYPEVLRVQDDRVRILHGGRHNHCFTSQIYRDKTRTINEALAKRYGNHPALLVWHISNEFGGACHCQLCQEAFRNWLKKKYDGNLDSLNDAWWTRFWSHTYTDWSQIESPAPHGEECVHGLSLDWKRFVTHQTIDFYRNEIAPFRELTPGVPITTNLMGTYTGLDYFKLARELDVVSWDNYPTWHGEEPDWVLASRVSFTHDLNRSLKAGRPFMLMESTPSATNWQPVSKLKRPGMHMLSSLQAVAHGADTVQYFQWRKSRGSSEKFHGAVVDHVGHENTRVFRDVAEVGQVLEKLTPVIGTTVPAEVAVIYDWENRWAIDDAQGPRIEHRDYLPTCEAHYRPFWEMGVPVDVVDMDCDFSKYKLLVAPMLYMVRPGVGERIKEFVKSGGTFVTTYWSGIVDENDLCFLGGFPGPLREVTGIWAEEIDALYDHEVNHLVMSTDNELGLGGEYESRMLCDLIHAESARTLATYKSDFYAGRPALTVNDFGQGKSYYIATRTDDRFLTEFYAKIANQLSIKRVLQTELPEGVTAQVRSDGQTEYIFILNFTNDEQVVRLGEAQLTDVVHDTQVHGDIVLAAYGTSVLVKNT